MFSTRFNTNGEGSTPPTCFQRDSTRTGGFNPSQLGFNTTPLFFDDFQRDRGGFNTTPLVFDTNRVVSTPPHLFSPRTEWVQPHPARFPRVSTRMGWVQPHPACFRRVWTHHEEGLPLLVLLLIFVINIILKLNKPNPDPNRTLRINGREWQYTMFYHI